MSSDCRTGIALGANLGQRLPSMTTAREQIFHLPQAVPPFLSSALYETEPVDCEPGAEKFLNAAIEIGYNGAAEELLAALQKIETALGRPPAHAPNQSRTLDLDLLYHGPCQVDQRGLQLPHPRLHLRAFVLRPLAEIRPDLVLPGQTRTVRELSENLSDGGAVVRALQQW